MINEALLLMLGKSYTVKLFLAKKNNFLNNSSTEKKNFKNMVIETDV